MTKPFFALQGASPTFASPLYVGRPNVGSKEALFRRIEDILERRWLTNDGIYLKEFEAEVAKRLRVEHAIAVCNGTVGLELACRAVGFKERVIVPAWTFIATAHALQWQQIAPIFCDVEESSHNICPRSARVNMSETVTGILGVHLWGRPANVALIERLACEYQIPVVWDASHAFGATRAGQSIGNFGKAEVFSFHATKVVNAFEGGIVTTNDGELAEKMRLMRNFGFAGFDRVEHVGTNGKMSEVSAAMGLTSLENYEEFVEVNQRNYLLYRQHLQGLAGLSVIIYDAQGMPNFQYVVVEVGEDCPLSRDELLRFLWSENVIARRYFYPGCHQMEPYRSRFEKPYVPVTDKLARRVLILPTGTAVTGEDVCKICELIGLAFQHAKDIKKVIPN